MRQIDALQTVHSQRRNSREKAIIKELENTTFLSHGRQPEESCFPS